MFRLLSATPFRLLSSKAAPSLDNVVAWSTDDVARVLSERMPNAFDAERRELFQMMRVDGHVLESLAAKRMAGSTGTRDRSLLDLLLDDGPLPSDDELKDTLDSTARLAGMVVVKRGR